MLPSGAIKRYPPSCLFEGVLAAFLLLSISCEKSEDEMRMVLIEIEPMSSQESLVIMVYLSSNIRIHLARGWRDVAIGLPFRGQKSARDLPIGGDCFCSVNFESCGGSCY